MARRSAASVVCITEVSPSRRERRGGDERASTTRMASTDVHRVVVENREACGAATDSNTRMRRRAESEPVHVEREQTGENNSLDALGVS